MQGTVGRRTIPIKDNNIALYTLKLLGSMFFLAVGAAGGQAPEAVTKEEKESNEDDDIIASPFGMTEEQDFISPCCFLSRTSANGMYTGLLVMLCNCKLLCMRLR